MRWTWLLLLLWAPPASAESYVAVVFARDEVDIVAEITGVLEEVHVRLGDPVEKGDLLVTFRDAPLRQELAQAEALHDAAQAELQLRRVELDQASRRVERRGSLDGAVSQEELAELEGAREAAASRVAMAEASVRERAARMASLRDDLARTQVRAPVTGTVAVRHVDAGGLVSMGSPLVRLLSHDTWLRFAVPPEVAVALNPDQPVSLRVDGRAEPIPAVIRQIAPDVDPIAELVFVEADLADDDLVVGTVGRVTLD